MDENTRKFFEKLAGVAPDNEQEEFSPQLVKKSKEAGEEKEIDSFAAKAVADADNIGDEKEDNVIDDEASRVGEPVLARAAAGESKKKTDNGAEDFEEGEGQLAIDVYQTPVDIIIEAPVAGVSADDIDLEISPESVTIKGRRVKITRVERKDYLHQECYWGKFSRTVILPQEIDPENATAAFKSGVLKIVLPKVSRQKTKKVKVRFE